MPRVATPMLVLLLACCGGDDVSPGGPSSAPTSKSSPLPSRTTSLGVKLSAERYDLVADGVHEGPAVAVADVLDQPATFAGKDRLRVEGTIVRVCKKKGCWIDVGTSEQSVHVTFARGCDRYVPLDAAGRTVLIEGSLRVAGPSAEERAHLREDARGSDDTAAVPEPRLVLSFIATGAALRR